MEKSNFFLSPGLHIGRVYAHFLKEIEITYQFIFLSARSCNIKSVKKIKKNMKKSNFFFRRQVCISPGCQRIFLKDLKLSINSYFGRPDRVILSRLKKKKKNKEKSNFFSSPGLDIGLM